MAEKEQTKDGWYNLISIVEIFDSSVIFYCRDKNSNHFRDY